ncbi:hypothetical protein ACWEF6_26405 [Amycolatopsis sp. NPDC004772]
MDLLRPDDPLVSDYAGQALAKVRIRLHGSREAREPRLVLRLPNRRIARTDRFRWPRRLRFF